MGEQDNLAETNHSTVSSANEAKKKIDMPMATVSETFSFVFSCGPGVTWLFFQGCAGGVLSGLVYPMLAYAFSRSFADISGAASDGMEDIRSLAFLFLGIGTYALVMGILQGWSFELVAYHASRNLRLQWFKALLRQDQAYYDVHAISGTAGQIGANANKYRRGVGRKMGEGIQFFITSVGGIAYAFYSSWRAALLIIAVLPLASFAAYKVMNINQGRGEHSGKAYKRAGSVAYSSVSSIKTVLSLNALQEMISQYTDATQEAFQAVSGVLVMQGFWMGSMMASFMLLYVILTLYGTKILTDDIDGTGCDPSSGVEDNDSCDTTGVDVFGAMLGIAFAGQGVSQFSNFFEAFTAARVGAYEALHSINRKPGAPEEIVYRTEEDDIGSTTHSKSSRKSSKKGEQAAEKVVKAIIPKYEIDSTSKEGLKPTDIKGTIALQNVFFTYPTRPAEQVLKGVSVEIQAGTTAAFVGPSGSGKSTIVGLLERFYDPKSGSVTLDGVDLKDLNVKHLRSSIGYVGQEPVLFATTIRGNIKYGNPNATDEEVEEAARMANAHDFITSFSDGYDTQVGDKGSQLSGGQKQRIAIARVLISRPKILLLDEATSALDSESELVVQDALDNIMQTQKITTIIIAHRLSTIRNADIINVLVHGEIKERGTHDELMALESYYYKLVQKQEHGEDDSATSPAPSRTSSVADLDDLVKPEEAIQKVALPSDELVPHIEFKNVSFAYPTRPHKLIFEDFNLTINRGETVALVGPSGGGKSTTVGLIERFYDPASGVIEYFGMDLRSLNVYWYRDQLGYVGQEPVLFDDTIARNISYGAPGASREDIEEAAKQANAYDFIMSFPDKFDTMVGERGTQLSGGQKQRVAIARALVKKPALLILDEATSALDNESEAIVQAAIDKLIQSREHTVVVIAHRLSTIRNADRIAVIAEGKVVEQGSHQELVAKADGRYNRLFESSKRSSHQHSEVIRQSSKVAEKKKGDDEEEDEKKEEVDWEAVIEKEEASAFNGKRVRDLVKPEACFMLIGAVGAVMAGGAFPCWGLLFAEMIDLLFVRVERCPDLDGNIIEGYETCEDYWKDTVDDMRERSFMAAIFWTLLLIMVIVGNVLMHYGFGMVSERLSKRVRDAAFVSLLRQEVAFFDKRSVGSITSQLQDDVARIHAFSADPVRTFSMALASVATGLTLSFIHMWPFALMAIACIPIMGFATSLEMAQVVGTNNDKEEEDKEGLNTPGGVIVETLLNVRTVAALTLEDQRFEDYECALVKAEPNYVVGGLMSGITFGLSQFLQQWINALQFWWGGWLLNNTSNFSFNDFLVSNFAVLFSLFGLGGAFQDISDRKEVEKSAGRVLYLMDRQSLIDPLAKEGKTQL